MPAFAGMSGARFIDMLSPVILIPAVLNGLLTGAVYALVALGLTLIYGVLHIINFAHGALLTVAMFAAVFAYKLLGLDPYVAAIGLTPIFFCLGYALQRFVLGSACIAVSRSLLLPTYYVNPHAGNAFVLIAFTIVVLGGMGSVAGALVGGLIIGVVESLCGLYLGESLGQIGIFVIFILVLLFRPSGLFGERA